MRQFSIKCCQYVKHAVKSMYSETLIDTKNFDAEACYHYRHFNSASH